MNTISKKILDFSAKLSKTLAIKSCGAASLFDTYQPCRPESVLNLAHFAKKSK
jgi:cyclic lactone autoinducer peptide